MSEISGYTIIAALLSHQVFKHYEPSFYLFASLFFASQVFLPVLFYLTGASPLTALGLAAYIASLYSISLTSSILVYRIYFHPLKNFPGPLLAKLSKLWAASTSIEGEKHHLILKLHQQYGDFVRIGPNELSINNACAVPTIYGPNGWQKGQFYSTISMLKNGDDSLHGTRNDVIHAQRRRTWNLGFTSKALSSYQDQVRERVNRFVEAMADRSGTDVDMRRWFQFFAWDVMFDLAFGGRGPELMKNGEDSRGIFNSKTSFFKILSIVGHTPALVPLLKLFLKLFAPHPKSNDFVLMCDTFFHARLNNPAPSPDIFHFLSADIGISRESTNEGLLRQARADAGLLIVAGSDTTASVMTSLSFLLLSEPGLGTYHKLQAELDTVYRDKEHLDSNELALLVPLLEGCINEAMRLFPIIPSGPIQRVSPDTGGMVCNRFIPPRTHVSVPTYVLHRDPRYFPEPNAFKPERWLPDSKGIHDKSAFIPFSIGPHGCIGRQLAYQEMRLLAAAIIRRFDATFAKSFDVNEYEKSNKDYFSLQIELPLLAVLTPRASR